MWQNFCRKIGNLDSSSIIFVVVANLTDRWYLPNQRFFVESYFLLSHSLKKLRYPSYLNASWRGSLRESGEYGKPVTQGHRRMNPGQKGRH